MNDETRDATTRDATTGPSIARGETGGGERGFASDVWVNFKRWNLKAVRNPFVLTASLVQPVVFLVLFTQVFGQIAAGAISRGGASVTYESFLLPAIVIQVSLVAAATSGIGLVNDIEEGMFEKVLVSPMNRGAVFLGKTLAEMLRITVQILVILGLGVVLGASVETGAPGALAIVVIGIVFAGWFTAFSNVVALVTRDQESTIIGANILQFPLLFVSSAFLPVELLPEWIQVISAVNPVTYGVDAARALVVEGWVWDAVLPNLGVLVGLDLVLGAVAVYMLNRASSSAVK